MASTLVWSGLAWLYYRQNRPRSCWWTVGLAAAAASGQANPTRGAQGPGTHHTASPTLRSTAACHSTSSLPAIKDWRYTGMQLPRQIGCFLRTTLTPGAARRRCCVYAQDKKVSAWCFSPVYYLPGCVVHKIIWCVVHKIIWCVVSAGIIPALLSANMSV